MIRLIVRAIDASHCPHVGGAPHETYRTFDIDAPDVENFLAGHAGLSGVSAALVGAEVVTTSPDVESVHRTDLEL